MNLPTQFTCELVLTKDTIVTYVEIIIIIITTTTTTTTTTSSTTTTTTSSKFSRFQYESNCRVKF